MMDAMLATCDLTDVMIDSGGYTNHQIWRKELSGEKPAAKEVKIDDYIQACRVLDGKVWQYVMLDRPKVPEESHRNLAAMLDAGLHPMPVMLISEPIERALELRGINPHVCVAGAVDNTTRYMEKRFKEVYAASGIGIHGLGYARHPGILTVPVASGDASSWCVGGQYGHITRYEYETGPERISWRDLSTEGAQTRNARTRWLDYLNTKLNVSYDQLIDPSSYRRICGVPAMATAYAFMRLSHHASKRGTRLFLAVPNAGWLSVVVALAGSANDQGYFDYPTARELVLDLNATLNAEPAQYFDRARSILRDFTTWETALPTLGRTGQCA